jgi:hypothetical protein
LSQKRPVCETAKRLNSNTTVIRLAQICLRSGDPLSAKLAFEATRRINPQLTQVRIAVEEAASRLSYRAVLKPTAGTLLTQR